MPPKPMTALAQWSLAMLLLVFALVLGGGQGGLGDTLCQLLALALIGLALWRHARDPQARLPAIAWLAALPLALPLLQLLPLPAAWWGDIPARAEIAAQWQAAGVDPQYRLSLVPLATERAFAWLLPAVAMFLAVLPMEFAARRRLVLIVLAFAMLSVLLGLAQQAGGVDSPLRFYAVTNQQAAVGFFANRNHYASLLGLSLPLAMVVTAMAIEQARDSGASLVLRALAGIGLCALLVLGIALAASRAVLLLAPLGVLLALPAVLAMRRRRGTRRVLAVALVVGGLLAVQFGFFAVAQRMQESVVDDSRLRFAPIVLAEAARQAPAGTGLGGFRRAFEGADREAPMEGLYVNHAHNDPIELWLEAGWLAPAVALPLLAFFAWAGWRAWRGDGDEDPQALALRRAAWVAVLLVLLHSLGDYPLRTTAHLTLLGLLVACTMRAERKDSADERSRIEHAS